MWAPIGRFFVLHYSTYGHLFSFFFVARFGEGGLCLFLGGRAEVTVCPSIGGDRRLSYVYDVCMYVHHAFLTRFCMCVVRCGMGGCWFAEAHPPTPVCKASLNGCEGCRAQGRLRWGDGRALYTCFAPLVCCCMPPSRTAFGGCALKTFVFRL